MYVCACVRECMRNSVRIPTRRRLLSDREQMWHTHADSSPNGSDHWAHFGVLKGQKLKNVGKLPNGWTDRHHNWRTYADSSGSEHLLYKAAVSLCLYVCLSVCLSVNQILHTYSGRYGTHSQLKKIDPPHPRGNSTSFVTSSNVEHVRNLNYRSTFDDVILRNVGGLIGDVIPLNLTDRLYIIVEYIITF